MTSATRRAAAVLLVTAAPASGLAIWNTGLDDSGAKVASQAVDPHWTLGLVQSPGPGTGPAYADRDDADFPLIYDWLQDGESPDSAWLAPRPNISEDGDLPGLWAFTTTFQVWEPKSARFTVRLAVDDSLAVPVGARLNSTDLNWEYAVFTPFSQGFTADSGFVSGQNTLTFFVVNGENPGGKNPVGLRAEFYDVVVPEPISGGLAAFAIAVGLLSRAGRRSPRLPQPVRRC